MAEKDDAIRREAALERARALLSEAMDLLDSHGGPVDATAHIDCALQRLRQECTPKKQ